MIIGESPWYEEVRFGRPFAGPSGNLLDSQLRRAGLERDSVVVTNVLWDRPPYLGWIDKHPDATIALAANRVNWERLIAEVKPRCIVTLGTIAMREVLGVSGLDQRQAYVHDSVYGIPVIPSYHPAFILRGNHKFTQPLFFALQRAKEVVASRGSWQRTGVEYLVDPAPREAAAYLFGGIS
jgi:DNA polymerase